MRALPLLVSTALALLAGCGVSQELYGARVAEVTALRARLDAEHKAALLAQTRCDRRSQDLEQGNARLADELRAAHEQLIEQARACEEAQARARQCAAPTPPTPAPTP